MRRICIKDWIDFTSKNYWCLKIDRWDTCCIALIEITKQRLSSTSEITEQTVFLPSSMTYMKRPQTCPKTAISNAQGKNYKSETSSSATSVSSSAQTKSSPWKLYTWWGKPPTRFMTSSSMVTSKSKSGCIS